MDKMGPLPGAYGLKQTFKNIIVKSHNAYSFDIRYVTSSSGPQQKLLKFSWSKGQGSHRFYIELYREIWKIFLSKCTRPIA